MTDANPHFHSGPRDEKDWKQFEKRCLDLAQSSLPNSDFRLQASRRLKASRKSMDIHVAERRQGGRGFVFECKHYTTSNIQTKHVDQVLEYKCRCKATAAVLLISKITDKTGNLPDSVRDYAKYRGVLILIVEDQSRGFLREWLARRQIRGVVR